MNILLLNQPWFSQELKAMGHNVVSFGAAGELDIILEAVPITLPILLSLLPEGFSPDVIIWHDNSAPFFVIGIEDSSIPIVFISVDTHHHSRWHKYLGHVCDLALVAQKDYIPQFLEVGVSPVWFPLWASRHVEPSEVKEHGACFIGTFNKDLNPERVEFFERLKEKIPVFFSQGAWWLVFPQSEIVINQTVKGDLNFRVFESMISGSMLLTERTGNGLFELFREGEHLVTYAKGDVDEAASVISKYLADKPAARIIAKAGREEVLKKHSTEARAEDLISIVKDLRRSTSPRRYFSAAVVYSVAGRVLKKVDHRASLPLFDAALRCAASGLSKSEEVDETIATEVINSCIERDLITGEPVGQRLLYSFSEKYEDQPLFSLAAIRGLLNEGRRSEAEELSKRRFPAPIHDVFRAAEETVTNLRKAVSGEML